MIIALAVLAILVLSGWSALGLMRGTLASRTKHGHGVREDKLAMFRAIKATPKGRPQDDTVPGETDDEPPGSKGA